MTEHKYGKGDRGRLEPPNSTEQAQVGSTTTQKSSPRACTQTGLRLCQSSASFLGVVADFNFLDEYGGMYSGCIPVLVCVSNRFAAQKGPVLSTLLVCALLTV